MSWRQYTVCASYFIDNVNKITDFEGNSPHLGQRNVGLRCGTHISEQHKQNTNSYHLVM